MFHRELSPSERLEYLHPLARTKPAVWQTATDIFPRIPDEMRRLVRYSAGELPIGRSSIDLTFLAHQDNLATLHWKNLLDQSLAERAIVALDRLQKTPAGLGAIRDVSISYTNQTLPGTNIPAHGYSPVFHQELPSGEQLDYHSGTIILFPPALQDGPYLGQIDSVPHIEGMMTHEYAHQFVGNTDQPLAQAWIQATGWQLRHGHTDSFICQYPGELITNYAGSHPVEDFAESFMLFTIRPKELQRRSPRRYHFFQTHNFQAPQTLY